MMKHSRRGLRRRRAGFTLLELILVMAILVLLSSLAVVGVMQVQRNSQRDAALTQIATLKQQCRMFKLNVGRYPASLNDLVTVPSGMTPQQWRGPYLQDGRVPLDPWGFPFNYSADEMNDIVNITSNGPDGQMGSADDVDPNAGR
ncbi:MAG: type II secretion system major pseudopilin GspG [Pirellulaceae bacterium]|nr:type II secretion system major pseudopilin GspG [Pirellulaceae bacterium]